MMFVRYAILGVLIEQPTHGYRLKKILDQRLSPLWGLTTGQIYQSLAAMERIALVESKLERRRSRPTRRIYMVTPAGKHNLSTWLDRTPSRPSRTVREESIVRMMFLDESRVPGFERWLDREWEEIRTLLVRVQQTRDTVPPSTRTELTEVYLTTLLNRLEADLKNCQLLQTWIRKRHPESVLKAASV